jgi:hypothetical protein
LAFDDALDHCVVDVSAKMHEDHILLPARGTFRQAAMFH